MKDDVEKQRSVYARTEDVMQSYNPKTWNYDLPINLWESLPWFLRWPLGAGLVIYFGGALAIGASLWLSGCASPPLDVRPPIARVP